MTRLSRGISYTMQNEAVSAVSADVRFSSTWFPKYRIGFSNQILELKEDSEISSVKDLVAKETELLSKQQQRLSVRDLANKFEKGLAAAAKLSDEAMLREAASLEKYVLLKKLRDALEALKGRVAGQNKEDLEESVLMVEALAVQLTQREDEIVKEKAEVKKLANFLKQASEDAKKLVDEERALARAEVESARAAVVRVEAALQEHERMSRASGKQEITELMKEVQEARRIKMLHQPSRVMDMEHELQALRIHLAEKSNYSVQLQKEGTKAADAFYEMEGTESLGSCLRIFPLDGAPDLSDCCVQWYHLASHDSKRELISGANKSAYAPEPIDVGQILQAEIVTRNLKITVSTPGPIEQAPGLRNYVEALARRHETEFTVVVFEMNGEDQLQRSVHVLHVGKMGMKLRKGKIVKAKEYYTSTMQFCGVRGWGNAAAQAAYWRAKTGLTFVLAFESERERNSAIMLARRFALDCNVSRLHEPEEG